MRFPCKLFRANGVISCQNINTVTKSLLIRWHGWLRLKINYHEFYPVSLKPVVLQLGSRQKDRKKILFKPSINSRFLHWNDVVSFDDLLFRFLFDLRVILTFTSLNEFKFTLDFWLPIQSPTQEIFRTEKYLEPMGSWFMGHQWLTLPRASNF